MTNEEHERLIRTSRGTPCGELMRRYWQPAALSEELPQGGPPVPVRLLGEDLVLFRDDKGRPGLLGLHCCHRGADLSYGRIEDGGLRCIYHGWLYDINGCCLDQPSEPEGGPHRDAVHQLAYPCIESAGMILAYLGPGEPPLLPSYDCFAVPGEQLFVTKLWSECNYLQGNEGNIDLFHNNFVHFIRRDPATMKPDDARDVVARFGSPNTLSGRGPCPGSETSEARLLDYGLQISKTRKVGPGQNYIRVATFVLPNLTVIPGGAVNWHVPIDDTHHWKFIIRFNKKRPIDKEKAMRERNTLAPPPDYKPIAHKANRYLQDRASMTVDSFSGISPKYFQSQDLCAIEGAGEIQNRSEEHLVASDMPIVIARKLLLKAIQDVQEGQLPANVVTDPKRNRFSDIVATYGTLPPTMTWKDYCDQLVQQGDGWQTNRP